MGIFTSDDEVVDPIIPDAHVEEIVPDLTVEDDFDDEDAALDIVPTGKFIDISEPVEA